VGFLAPISVNEMDPIAKKVQKIFKLVAISKGKPKVRELAMALVKHVAERNYMGEIASIFYWVRDRIRYTRDPWKLDVFEDAEWTLRTGQGDCDAHAVLLGSLLEAIGYPVRMKVVSYDGVQYTHIYPVVGDRPGNPTRWIPLDATIPWARPGYEKPYVKARVFQAK